MNETIEVRFEKKGKRLRVVRQLVGGIEFEEPEPLERTLGIQFSAQNEITRIRMNSIRRVQGWDPGVFKLSASVENGSILLRGVNKQALPPGRYRIRLQIEEARSPQAQTAAVHPDQRAIVTFDVTMEDREVEVDLADLDPLVSAVLDRSRIDGIKAVEWLQDSNRRATRRACLLNLLASLRSRPRVSSSLLSLVQEVFFVANDRIYARVDRGLVDTLQKLADEPARPFFGEGKPLAAIHGRLLTAIPEEFEVKSKFKDLLSFRAEGRPSMQVVVAVPPADVNHTYAEMDLDLGNPLQGIVGFFVHAGELLDGKPTNHLDMRILLAKTAAKEFLHYDVAKPA